MPELAHFTLAELPGTAAIWIAGIGMGLAIAARSRAAVAPLALMAAFAALGMLGDASGWATGTRVAVDLAFLGAAATLAVALWRDLFAPASAGRGASR